MSKLLIDTNILVYAIDEDSQFYTKAQSVLYDSNSILFTTSKNLSEFLVVITKGVNAATSVGEALAVLNDYQNLLTVIYPNEKSFSIFKELLRKYQPTGLRIHDLEIISIGLAHNLNQVATINIKDFNDIEEITLAVIA